MACVQEAQPQITGAWSSMTGFSFIICPAEQVFESVSGPVTFQIQLLWNPFGNLWGNHLHSFYSKKYLNTIHLTNLCFQIYSDFQNVWTELLFVLFNKNGKWLMIIGFRNMCAAVIIHISLFFKEWKYTSPSNWIAHYSFQQQIISCYNSVFLLVYFFQINLLLTFNFTCSSQ